jgi:hypothetical protein
MKDGRLVRYKFGDGARLDWDEVFFKVNLQVNGAIYADWIAAFLLKLFGGFAWDNARQSNCKDILPGTE